MKEIFQKFINENKQKFIDSLKSAYKKAEKKIKKYHKG